MNITLYKFLAPNDSNELDFYETRVLPEDELRDEFFERYGNNSFVKENLEYYKIPTDELDNVEVQNMDIDTIVDCFNDNGNFDTDNVFLVQEITVCVDDVCYDNI